MELEQARSAAAESNMTWLALRRPLWSGPAGGGAGQLCRAAQAIAASVMAGSSGGTFSSRI